MRIILSRRARRELEEAVDYLTAHSPQAARALGERLANAGALLPGDPLMGRPSALPAIRELPLRGTSYLLIYAVREDRIEILSLFHTARDPGAKP